MIKFRRQIGWTLACLVAGAVGASSAAAACGLRPITVDASQPVGVIRSLQGVSGTPLPGDASHPDFTSQFHQLGVDIVRTHDVESMLDDVEDLVRRYPTQALLAAAGVGFLVGRIFKSDY